MWAGREHFGAPASGILNACRAWLFWRHGRLASKIEGGEWAATQLVDGVLVRQALHYQRTGERHSFRDADVAQFIRAIYERISQVDLAPP